MYNTVHMYIKFFEGEGVILMVLCGKGVVIKSVATSCLLLLSNVINDQKRHLSGVIHHYKAMLQHMKCPNINIINY